MNFFWFRFLDGGLTSLLTGRSYVCEKLGPCSPTTSETSVCKQNWAVRKNKAGAAVSEDWNAILWSISLEPKDSKENRVSLHQYDPLVCG